MSDIEKLVEGLKNPDNNFAYKCLLELEKISAENALVYQFFGVFSEMLLDTNSYIRTRAMILIAENAKWDADNKIDEIIEKFLEHINYEKPITARKCIMLLPEIAKFKPDLKEIIVKAISKANPSKYRDTMGHLITKDLQNSLKEIES